MKKISAVLLVICLMVIPGCGAGTQKENTHSTAGNNSTNSGKTGAEIYAIKCTACHGADGNMGVGGAKKIPASVLTLQEREQLINNGKGTMPAFSTQLSADEIKQVAQYTLTLK